VDLATCIQELGRTESDTIHQLSPKYLKVRRARTHWQLEVTAPSLAFPQHGQYESSN
jgi:hypothetical protein